MADDELPPPVASSLPPPTEEPYVRPPKPRRGFADACANVHRSTQSWPLLGKVAWWVLLLPVAIFMWGATKRGGGRIVAWIGAAAVVVVGITTIAASGASDTDKSAAAPTTAAVTVPTTVATTTPTTQPPTTVVATTVATTAAPTAAATTTPTTPAPPVLTVTKVVDGDTVDLSTGETVRIIGIDTPEVGRCGHKEATDALEAMVAGHTVTATPGARDDVDKYGRILRYIDTDGGVDVGLEQINAGLAIARYDSRDGYGHHPREEAYIAADNASPDQGCWPGVRTTTATTAAPPPATTGVAVVSYANCAAVKAAGKAPLYRGQPGYSSKLDRDGDGVACET